MGRLQVEPRLLLFSVLPCHEPVSIRKPRLHLPQDTALPWPALLWTEGEGAWEWRGRAVHPVARPGLTYKGWTWMETETERSGRWDSPFLMTGGDVDKEWLFCL